MSKFSLKIVNARLVTGDGIKKQDIGIKDDKIKSVKPGIKGSAKRTVDAEDCFVLPGPIDVHTHPIFVDDVQSLSFSAAHGGITTVIYYEYAEQGEELTPKIKDFIDYAGKDSHLDFAVHAGVFNPETQSEEIPEVTKLGVNTFKMFMAYARLGRMTDDYQLLRTLDIISEVGGMGMVHAENGLAMDYLKDKYEQKNTDPIESYLSTRPAELEAEAINRALSAAEVADCPIYIPHMTSREDVQTLRRYKERGNRVYGETCPQYLTLTNDKLSSLGPLAKIGPPLRKPDDQEVLWEGLRDDSLEVIASDHAPKEKSIEDEFSGAAYGSPQIETMLPVTYHEGVNKGRLSMPKFVEKFSENPAKIFGLYPDKGSLETGTDADLVIFDPKKPHRITSESQHSTASYTLYEDMECLGKQVMSVLRGDIIFEEGNLNASPGQGKFLKTEID